MIVVFTNNKGGTGKSTYSTIIAQLAANSGMDVVAADLDHAQMHLSLFLRNLDADIQIPVYASLGEVEKIHHSFIVIDTPPAFSEETLTALQMADVVVVPINRDKTGVLGLLEVSSHVDKGKIVVVTSQWKMKTRFNADLYEQLESLGWKAAVNIPENIQIIHNRDANRSWDYGIAKKHAEPYLRLLSAILKTASQSNGGKKHGRKI
jgi:cellulose biosynthesis protein BcsQ